MFNYEKLGKKCVDITEEIPFSIPATWQCVRVKDVFQLNPKNEADDGTLAAFIPMEKIGAGYKSDTKSEIAAIKLLILRSFQRYGCAIVV